MFQEVEHTADCAILVRGVSLAELLVEAARGMAVLTGGRAGRPRETRRFSISADDRETLLVTWLEELAFLLETEGLLMDQFVVLSCSPQHLTVQASGGPAEDLRRMLKAVTFHDLAIQELDSGLQVTIVFDV